MTRDKAPKRRPDGRFAPGSAPGPGRSAGTGEHRRALLAAVTPEDVQKVAETLRDLALDGDVGAAKVLLERVLGRPKDQPELVNLDLPPVDSAQSCAAAVRIVAAQATSGLLDVHVADKLVDLLHSACAAGEVSRLLEQHELPDQWRRN